MLEGLDPPDLTAPLAQRLRPQRLDDIVGQAHLLGSDAQLRRALDRRHAHAMLFWGPPGVGKTTLARLLAAQLACAFSAMSAVTAGVKEVRDVIEEARVRQAAGVRTLLFVDEIHRFNKAQQDALLPHVESGLVVLVGATTENPSFTVNAALLSRLRVYVLKPLSHDALYALLDKALRLEVPTLEVTQAARDQWVVLADGDGRRLLNLVELALASVAAAGQGSLDAADVIAAAGLGQRRFDRQGDVFYDQISALHKAVRGSHPDAALYWLVRMFDGGADPAYLARRIVRMAWEDVGLAEPQAARMALDAAATYERLGSPEGELALASVVLYLSVAPKSNASYVAYTAARRFVAKDHSREVPLALRNAPTGLMAGMGYGEGYRYAHDEAEGYAAGMHYLPDGMAEPRWYQPVSRGLELKIAEKLARLRALDAAAGAQY